MKNILKLIFKDEVQEIFDHFSALFDIKILFYSANGEIVKVGLNKPNCRFCNLVQNSLYGRQSCLDMDETRRQQARIKGQTICYQCHAGLDESITPIYNDNALVGFLGFGQFRTTDEISPKVLQDWREKYNNDELLHAFKEIPYYPVEKMNHIVGLVSILVKYIVSQRMITIMGDFLLHKLISYIEKNISKPVSLSEAAAFVKKSESTVSHLFKKKINMSFKQTVIEMKLDRADEYLRMHRNMKIADIAEKVGYEDPLYFSRLYRKSRKCSPRQFQKKIFSEKEIE